MLDLEEEDVGVSATSKSSAWGSTAAQFTSSAARLDKALGWGSTAAATISGVASITHLVARAR